MTDTQEPFVVKRAPYWAYLFVLSLLNVLLTGGSDPFTVVLLLAVLIGWIVLTYARVKDIGWGGWTAIFCIVPLFNIVIGCLKSKPEELQHD